MLGPMLANYDRFNGLCPGVWLETWTKEDPKEPKKPWWFSYPADGGFALSTWNLTIRAPVDLLPGTLVDRFGKPDGNFLAPADTPYSQRAIPPFNLIPAGKNATVMNYHRYRVKQKFSVTMGPIQPWFGQPGYGTQYLINGYADVAAAIAADVLEEVE
jgi:hypothetical protein